MGLADRHYMRQPAAGWRWTATLALIVALVVAFFLQYGPLRSVSNEYLTLSLDGLKRGFVWQLLTFQFMHSGPAHLAMNGLTLYIFGREMESVLGKARFLTLYFASGVIGGLIQVLAGWIAPHYFGGAVLGASAGIFGIVAAFATLFPNQILTMFLIPISFKAKVLLFVSAAIAILGPFFPKIFGANVANAAHIGGMLSGIAWIKFGWHHDYVQLPWEGWFSGRKALRQSRKSELVRATSARPGSRRAKSDTAADLPEDEFISREVDPILDKISQHGIQSLTERERKILEAARNKMAKR
jgi:membrane associated rhomboid family serine protease